MLLLIIIISIILNASADGIRFKDITHPNKFNAGLYHILYALFILSLLSLLILNLNLNIIEWLLIIAGYSLIRFGIFDFILNFTANKHFLYIGESSFIDRLLNKIFKTANSLMFLYFIRGLAFIGGLYIIQHYTEII